MPTQLALCFDEVPITCPIQQRYHALAPILAGRVSPSEQSQNLNIGYSTVTRWLREFRENGMPGLFPNTKYPREPNTPEKIIVLLVYYKCCVPSVSDRELVRVIESITGNRLHNETIKALLDRYFLWRHQEFCDLVKYPIPSDPELKRLEMVKLHHQGWSESRIALLLGCNRKTVRKWLRRAQHQSQENNTGQLQLMDLSRSPHNPQRKVYFGTIHAVLTLQKKFGYAGWFRIKGYLEAEYQIYLSPATIKKIMALNRRTHLAPQRPIAVIEPHEIREGPKKSQHPFEHIFVDFRYLDAKPQGVQLYSTLLIEGLSRSIIAGSLTTEQETGVLLHVYFQGLLKWGLWDEIISDHGGQFRSLDWIRVNKRLGINHFMYDKGHPWQNLIESQFGIQARLGEYHWERCKTVDEAVEFHRDLIRDHNRLPHWAHHKRNDGKQSPLAVLSDAKGKHIEPAELQRAFGQRYCQRMTDARGFVRIGGWKIYIEEGLVRTPVQLSYWDGRLRAEHQTQMLTEYQCKWSDKSVRPTAISGPTLYAHPFQSKQLTLFDPQWIREPIEPAISYFQRSPKSLSQAEQLRLYLGPELVKLA